MDSMDSMESNFDSNGAPYGRGCQARELADLEAHNTIGACDWLSTHSCMPLQQLPTVTKDANAHARLGYVRSQSLASTTTFPVETRGRLGKLLPTSALKNIGKTKSTPLSKTPASADEHIFSPPDDAHRCSSDAESTRKADRANFQSSSTRPHSHRSPDKMPRLTSAWRRDTCTEVSRVSRSAWQSADRHDVATERTDVSERGKVGHSSEHRAGDRPGEAAGFTGKT